MKKHLIFFALIFTTLLSAETKHLDQQQNHFLKVTDSQFTPKVNPISGECTEEATDLVIAGSEPISFRRYYNHFAPYDGRTASWRYNPEACFVANFEWEQQELFAAVGDKDGSVTSFKPAQAKRFHYQVGNGFAAAHRDGRSHPLNTTISYQKHGDLKDKNRFQYKGTIKDGSGRERSFTSPIHRWTHQIHWRNKEKSWVCGYTPKYTIYPNVWTPYQVPIHEEKLPNGNILRYSYIGWKKEEMSFPIPSLLSKITAYNSDKSKILGYLTLHYGRDKHNEVLSVSVRGSDGRRASLQHNGEATSLLGFVKTPNAPQVSYGFQGSNLNLIKKPDGRLLKTKYKNNQVSAQYAPVGPKGEMCPVSQYEYHDHSTTFLDAEENQTIYHFDDHKRFTKIETYQDEALYRIDRLEWDPKTGNLTQKTVEDPLGNTVLITQFEYDANQNPILEKKGDGTTWRTIHRTYSDDGFNLKLSESDREGKKVCYAYVPHTNLLASELTYDNTTLCQRTFHFYDDCAVCIKTITDDGCSEDPYDLENISYRRITEITPRQELPCFGLPEKIEEKSIDASGHEILLSKVVYTYTPAGQVLQEDHFDTHDTFCYSIMHGYDDRERLISTTDPMGATTRYTYDANHNITRVQGAREDQSQKITYDKANRPTSIDKQQADGTWLTTHKEYDRLGRVTATIDECGQATHYTYDALGRVTKITYPDGSCEIKEYDLLGNLTKQIDPQGYATNTTHNCFGEKTKVVYPDGSKERFSYNSTGTLHSKKDKNGATTLYTYDLFDHPIQVAVYSSANQLLKCTTATWSPFCQLSETKADLKTTYFYDFAGRKTQEQKGYQTTLFAYDPLGRLAVIQNGKTRHIKEYDFCDRLVETRVEHQGTIQKQESYRYDLAGNRTHTTSEGNTTEAFYNTDGKPLWTKNPLGHTTYYAYAYKDHFVKTMTHPKGIQTMTVYDGRGRETKSFKKNALGEVIHCSETSYDLSGHPIKLTQAVFSGPYALKTITHQWVYDPMGHVVSFIEADTKKTDYQYDEKGRLQTILKPDGSKIAHQYDDLGRLIRYSSTDFDYHYTFDEHDRVVKVLDTVSNTTTIRSYDSLGHILEETLANGLSLSNTFDARGRRTKNHLPDGSEIAYTYEGLYLQSVTKGAFTTTYTQRDLKGKLLQATLPNGPLTITRDALGHYASIQAPYFRALYPEEGYDATGHLVNYTYQDSLGAVTCHYTYDDLGQLIQENEHTYACDSLYNRLQKDLNVYSINPLSQVTHDGEQAYTYDLCGNLISDACNTYTYDTLDRLIAVQKDNTRVEYTYDPFHRRLSKTVLVGNVLTEQTHYLWDGKNEIGAVDATGLIELRVLGEGLGAEIGAAVLIELHGTPYLPIHDHRGALVTLIDLKTNTPTETYRYTAFGEELTHNRLAPWRFSSKRFDQESGFLFFGRRYYHPNLGRWITQDPKGFADGPNLYAYLHNSPLSDFDLYGLFSFGACCRGVSNFAFRGVEWFGANLVPLPYVRGFVESVGRWGSGGSFFGPSRLRTPQNEIITIPGKVAPGVTVTHGNGIMTTRENAIKQAQDTSRSKGGAQVDLLYQGTNGLMMDLFNCFVSKMGIPTSYNYMCARYFAQGLRDDPNHIYEASVHSRGGIQMKTTGNLLSQQQREHLHVMAYGTGTLIPKDFFGSAKNIVSRCDIVPMTNPIAYILGLFGVCYDVEFVQPTVYCPMVEHGYLQSTYYKKTEENGRRFSEKYF